MPNETVHSLSDVAHIEPIVINLDGSIQAEVSTTEEVEFLGGWCPVTNPTDKDEAESERVGKRIGAWPKECWFNARRAVMKLKEYADANYVEGCSMLGSGLVIEHGWVCRPDGTIIDPTLPTQVADYFPGLEFRGREGIREFLATPRGRKCRKSPFFYAFGWGGGDSPSFSDAMRKAFAHQLSFLTTEAVVS
jgi:hypothetical protein